MLTLLIYASNITNLLNVPPRLFEIKVKLGACPEAKEVTVERTQDCGLSDTHSD